MITTLVPMLYMNSFNGKLSHMPQYVCNSDNPSYPYVIVLFDMMLYLQCGLLSLARQLYSCLLVKIQSYCKEFTIWRSYLFLYTVAMWTIINTVCLRYKVCVCQDSPFSLAGFEVDRALLLFNGNFALALVLITHW